MNKKFFNPASKTHWVNAAGLLITGVLNILPGLEGTIPLEWYPYILAGFLLANHILRNLTDTAIDEK